MQLVPPIPEIYHLLRANKRGGGECVRERLIESVRQTERERERERQKEKAKAKERRRERENE